MWTKAINDQLGAIETILQNAKRIMRDHIGFDAKRAVKMLQTLNVSYGTKISYRYSMYITSSLQNSQVLTNYHLLKICGISNIWLHPYKWFISTNLKKWLELWIGHYGYNLTKQVSVYAMSMCNLLCLCKM